MAIDLTREGREALRDTENQRKIQTLANLGSGVGVGLSAFGAFNKKLLPALIGLSAATTGGYISGQAKKRENKALDTLRKYHHLKESPKVINFSAMLPDRKKVASVTKEAILGSIGHFALTGNPLALAADIALLPALARGATSSTRKALHVAAKQELGKTLTPGDKTRAAVLNIASAIKDKAHGIKFPALRGVADYATSYMGPYATAAKAGPMLGKTLREVEKVSPRYADLLIDAIPGGEGQKRLIETLKLDKDKFQKAMDILQDTRSGRFLKGKGGSSGSAFLGKYLQDPGKAIHDARQFKAVEDNIIRAGQIAGLAIAGSGAGHMVGRFSEEKKASFWDGFKKASSNS